MTQSKSNIKLPENTYLQIVLLSILKPIVEEDAKSLDNLNSMPFKIKTTHQIQSSK